ncbi:MAG TPA: 3-hydroxyacyl-CoA dehydrogenase family protein, partial [Bryobacteraceae bacterium]|nr:3-hydroxyacyl-CoA dehydrogenase family protein [Bryobacteraceae bacterium]
LGDKTGAGFYKRVGAAKELHAIDWRTLEYHPAATSSFPQLAALAKVADLPHRLRSLVQADGVVGKFLSRVLSDYVEYAASLVPEISDRIVEIDRAMRWGYGHTFGPFELWDTLGFSTTAQRMIAERRTLPPIARAILDSGEVGFYRDTAVEGEPIVEYFDLATRSFRSLELTPGVLVLSDLKKARGVLERNDWASLVDLRDGVLCMELHGPKDTVDTPTIEMVKAAISLLSTDYDALVIAGESADFASGTNLQSLWTLIEAEHWTELASRLETWHEVLLNLKYAPKPVIAAAYGRTSGIAYDLLQYTCAVQVHAELYLGANETSYGLVPLGGATTQLLLRMHDPIAVLDLLMKASTSSSAAEAVALGYLPKDFALTMNKRRLIADAKARVLSLVSSYQRGDRADALVTGGALVRDQVERHIERKQADGQFSPHDVTIARSLAYVLSGGDERIISEQELLRLERDAVVSLCQTQATKERLSHWLTHGKALRN